MNLLNTKVSLWLNVPGESNILMAIGYCRLIYYVLIKKKSEFLGLIVFLF